MGICGLIMILVGMVGGLIASVILELFEDSRKYIDKIIRALMSIAMVSLVVLAVFLKYNLYLAMVFLSLIGKNFFYFKIM